MGIVGTHFDGTASGAITPAPYIITKAPRYLDLDQRSLRYDEDGDVIMTNWAEWESIGWSDGEEPDGDYEDFTWANQSSEEPLFEGSRWNRGGYRGLATDFIARVDIEIR